MRIVDNRGKSCPEPVINTKIALDTHPDTTIVSIVDNEVAKSNVLKFARSRGFFADAIQQGGDFHITISRVLQPTAAAPTPSATSNTNNRPSLYLVTADEVGRGQAELGRALMKTFLYALAESGVREQHLVFLHGGAVLACQDSPVLPSLERLKQQGWHIATCGACLDFYQLKDKLAIGEVTNMYSIVELMATSEKVITI